MEKPVGLWGAYVMGLAFAFGWTPCIGPILAAILAVAGSEDTVPRGRDAAGGLFGRARHSLPARGAGAGAVHRRSCGGSARAWAMVEKAMGVLLVADRRRVPDRLVHAAVVLAARDVPGAGAAGLRQRR